MPIGTLRLALVLGLLACVGPLAIDMYLPALPMIADDLGTNVAGSQMTLTAYFLAFGVSQLVYGPVADQVGRKRPLYVGLSIFIAGAIGCALAPSIGWLTAFRFLQGIGGAAVMVIPRAIIRDVHTGPAATRLMATIMLVISVSPMLAPLAGSGIMLVWGWRSIFFVLAAAAILSLLITTFVLRETLEPARRVPVNTASLLRGVSHLLTDRKFVLLTFIGGFGMASFFVFLASASFVYTGQFGLSTVGFSLAFAINAIGFFSASQFAAGLGERFGTAKVITTAVLGFAIFTTALLVLVLAGYGSLPVIVGFLFLGNACLGLVIPSAMVMALDDHGAIAGLASSLGGTLQMVVGGGMIVVVSPFFNGTATPMVVAIATCALTALVLSRLVVARSGRLSRFSA